MSPKLCPRASTADATAMLPVKVRRGQQHLQQAWRPQQQNQQRATTWCSRPRQTQRRVRRRGTRQPFSMRFAAIFSGGRESSNLCCRNRTNTPGCVNRQQRRDTHKHKHKHNKCAEALDLHPELQQSPLLLLLQQLRNPLSSSTNDAHRPHQPRRRRHPRRGKRPRQNVGHGNGCGR